MKFFENKSVLVKLGFWLISILLVIYLGRTVFGDYGLYELNRMSAELETLKAENARLEEENIALYRTINRLKDDPEYIEHIARQELQMIGKDEIVFKFRKSQEEEEKTGREADASRNPQQK